MSSGAFELISLTMRYVFTGLMLLIVLRAARGALVDSRRAARLRRLSPMTGLSGELVLLDALPKLPRGMRWPVIREGSIGASRRADIRIRHSSLRGRHALFQLTESGLTIRTHAAARMRDSLGNPAKELTLLDGDSFYLGSARLLLVLSVPDLPRRPVRTDYGDEPESDLFDIDAWLDERPVQSDPEVSPIFDTRPDPFDGESLHARPRASARPVRRPEPPRRAPDSDSVSPIFDADRIVSTKPSRTNRINPRAFLDEEESDDLFKTDEKF